MSKYNSSLRLVYDVFRKHINIIGKDPKSVNQYKPYGGFENASFYKDFGKDFEEEFLTLLIRNDYEALKSLIKQAQNTLGELPQSLKSYKTYSNDFLKFLTAIISERGKYKAVLTSLQSRCHIDGADKLVIDLGGETAFIRKAIEASYFFSPILVYERFHKIIDAYNKKEPIAARHQGERVLLTQGVEQCGYPNCYIDNNGNSAVKKVIKDLTGYSVSAGKTSDFMNYKISHIWGNTQDPRYFTNLWNLVLVPAWANDLLDKTTSDEGSLESKFLCTIKEICLRHYDMLNLEWNQIGIWDVPSVSYPTDIQDGLYTFNVIGKRNNGIKGKIIQETIRIQRF